MGSFALVFTVVGLLACLAMVGVLVKIARDNSRSAWVAALRTARWSVRTSTGEDGRILVLVERVAHSGKRRHLLGSEVWVAMEGDAGIDEVFWAARVAEEVRLAGVEAERLNDELFGFRRPGTTSL